METSVALSLCPFQTFRTFLGSFSLKVIVHLTDNSLKISLEETIATGDEYQGEDCEGKEVAIVLRCGNHRHRQADISERHYDKSALNGPLVVLCLVGNDTANKAHNVDCCKEKSGNEARCLVAHSELTAQEEG